MSEEKKEIKIDESKPVQKDALNTAAPGEVLNNMKKNKKVMRKGGRGNSRGNREEKEKKEFDSKIINIRRVTRVYKGGKRMRLSVFLAVGDKKGRVGLGIGKGADVRSAEEKAYNRAVKNLVMINLKGTTIQHAVDMKYKASKIILRPAAPGTGIIAGAPMRSVLEMVGVKNLLSKRYGSTNSITIAYATLNALLSLKSNRL